MFKKYYTLLLAALLLQLGCLAQGRDKNKLAATLQHIADTMQGRVGIGVMGLDFNETILVNDSTRYPMQSVFKFPLGIAILHNVDKGSLSLQKKITIPRSKLVVKTYSPMLKDFTADTIYMTIADLLYYSVSKSDNNACDLLFEIAGGPAKVDQYFKQAGVKGMNINTTEAGMGRAWELQYTNWCHPSAMLQILRLFKEGRLLRPATNAVLMRLMEESENPDTRILGQLPNHTPVAHKTGTSDTNPQGIKAATNDVGIITLPDGRQYALVVYVKDYKGGITIGEKTIADISKAVWDHYTDNGRYDHDSTVASGISTRILHLFDPSRKRPIDVAIYTSLDKKARNGKLVVLSHGYDTSSGAFLSYGYIVRMLVREGYCVVSLQQNLASDPPVPVTGNIYEQRMPLWERGVANIQFVLDTLKRRYPSYNYQKLTLIGHSHGGDISALYATRYGQNVERLMTLDNRRMPLPRTSQFSTLSIRSSDQPADSGVLPTDAEKVKYPITIVKANVIHNDMGGAATSPQKAEINGYIQAFLHGKLVK